MTRAAVAVETDTFLAQSVLHRLKEMNNMSTSHFWFNVPTDVLNLGAQTGKGIIEKIPDLIPSADNLYAISKNVRKHPEAGLLIAVTLYVILITDFDRTALRAAVVGNW